MQAPLNEIPPRPFQLPMSVPSAMLLVAPLVEVSPRAPAVDDGSASPRLGLADRDCPKDSRHCSVAFTSTIATTATTIAPTTASTVACRLKVAAATLVWRWEHHRPDLGVLHRLHVGSATPFCLCGSGSGKVPQKFPKVGESRRRWLFGDEMRGSVKH
jgi:hypothetical protein